MSFAELPCKGCYPKTDRSRKKRRSSASGIYHRRFSRIVCVPLFDELASPASSLLTERRTSSLDLAFSTVIQHREHASSGITTVNPHTDVSGYPAINAGETRRLKRRGNNIPGKGSGNVKRSAT